MVTFLDTIWWPLRYKTHKTKLCLLFTMEPESPKHMNKLGNYILKSCVFLRVSNDHLQLSKHNYHVRYPKQTWTHCVSYQKEFWVQCEVKSKQPFLTWAVFLYILLALDGLFCEISVGGMYFFICIQYWAWVLSQSASDCHLLWKWKQQMNWRTRYPSGLYWSLIVSHQKSPCSFVCTYLFKTLISLSFLGLVFVRFGWMALFWTFSAPKDKSIWKENVPSLHLRRSVNSSSQCHHGCVSQAPVGQKNKPQTQSK